MCSGLPEVAVTISPARLDVSLGANKERGGAVERERDGESLISMGDGGRILIFKGC